MSESSPEDEQSSQGDEESEAPRPLWTGIPWQPCQPPERLERQDAIVEKTLDMVEGEEGRRPLQGNLSERGPLSDVKPPEVELDGTKWRRSMCGQCLHDCEVWFQLDEDGVPIRIEGDDCQDNMGNVCPKGLSVFQRVFDPNRIKQPLKRTNPKKGPNEDPEWEEISWEEALGIITEKFKEVREEDPRKLLVSIGNFQRLWTWGLGAALGNPGYFNAIGIVCGGNYHPTCSMLDGAFAATNDYEYCDYWLNMGASDGFSGHLHLAGSAERMADRRVDGDMKLVTIDPRLSKAAANSEEWIPILPGTDRAFLLAMINLMINEGVGYDREFVKEWTNGPYLIGPDGFYLKGEDSGKPLVWDVEDDEPKEYDADVKEFAIEGTYEVNGEEVKPAFQILKEEMEEYTPEWAEEITTVPAETIREVTEEYVENAQIGSTIEIEGKEYPLRPAAVNYYRGGQSHSEGQLDSLCLHLANILIGNVDVPGGHIGWGLRNEGRIFTEKDGTLHGDPHDLAPGGPIEVPPNACTFESLIPEGAEATAIAVDAMNDPEKYNLDYEPSMLLNIHSNLLWNMTDFNTMVELFKKLDFIVDVSIIEDETAQMADIVLPPDSKLESEHVPYLCEAPDIYGTAFRRPIIDRLYNTKDDINLIYEICDRVGALEDYNAINNYMLRLKPEHQLDLEKKYTNDELMDLHLKSMYGEERGLEWFKENGHTLRRMTPEEKYMPYRKDNLENIMNKDLRLTLYFERLLHAKEAVEEEIEGTDFEWWDTSNYVPIPEWKKTHVQEIHDDPDNKYDMYLIDFRQPEVLFSEGPSYPWIRETLGKLTNNTGIWINSETAEEKGIEDGDTVRIESPVGEVEGPANVTECIHPNVVAVPNSLTVYHKKGHIDEAPKSVTNKLRPSGPEVTDTTTGGYELTAPVSVEKKDR